MFRRLIVWIMLIALPLQSYAAASMLYCAPLHHGMVMQTMVPGDTQAILGDNADTVLAHAEHCDMAMAGDGDDTSDQSSQPHKVAGKCSACSACCMCTMAVFFSPADWLTSSGAAIMAPHPVDTLTSVSLEALQHPPRSSSR